MGPNLKHKEAIGATSLHLYFDNEIHHGLGLLTFSVVAITITLILCGDVALV